MRHRHHHREAEGEVRHRHHHREAEGEVRHRHHHREAEGVRSPRRARHQRKQGSKSEQQQGPGEIAS